jgi:hypothetical protein
MDHAPHARPGTYTYFCRVHPFMRGAFRIARARERHRRFVTIAAIALCRATAAPAHRSRRVGW